MSSTPLRKSNEKIKGMEDSLARRPNRQALFDVASEQHGYFTADQAARSPASPRRA